MTTYDCAITECKNKNVSARIQKNPQGPDGELIPMGWGTVTVSGMPQQSYLFCDYHLRLVSSGLLQKLSIKEPKNDEISTSHLKQPPLRLENDATQAEVPSLRGDQDQG